MFTSQNKLLILLLILTNFSCHNSASKTLEDIKLEAPQIQAINQAIDNYNDKTLSKIIELRDYNFRKIERLFCIHQIVKTRKEAKPSRFFNVTAKIYCAEVDLKGGINGSSSDYKNLSNLSLLPVRYLLVESKNGLFSVSTYELPRIEGFYQEDLVKFFTKEEINEIDSAKLSNEEIGDRLRKKVTIYQKSQPKSK
jgi:hypothetical protein